MTIILLRYVQVPRHGRSRPVIDACAGTNDRRSSRTQRKAYTIYQRPGGVSHVLFPYRPEGAWWAQPGDDPWAVREPEETQRQPAWGGQQAAYPPVHPYFRPPGEPLRRPGDAPFSSPYAPPYTSAHVPPPPPPPQAHELLTSEPAAPARASRRTPLLVTLAVLIALLGGAVGGVIGWGLSDHGSNDLVAGPSSLPAIPRGSQQRPQGSVPGIAAQLLQRVVSIQVEQGVGLRVRHPVRRLHPHQQPRGRRRPSAAATITRRVPRRQRRRRAQSSAATACYDLAVLKVDASGRCRPLHARATPTASSSATR